MLVFDEFGSQELDFFCHDRSGERNSLSRNRVPCYRFMSQINLFVQFYQWFATPLRHQRWRSLILVFLGTAILGWGMMPSVALARTETPVTTAQSIQPYLDRVIERISEFRLDNGIKFIVLKNRYYRNRKNRDLTLPKLSSRPANTGNAS